MSDLKKNYHVAESPLLYYETFKNIIKKHINNKLRGRECQ